MAVSRSCFTQRDGVAWLKFALIGTQPSSSPICKDFPHCLTTVIIKYFIVEETYRVK